MQQSSNNQSGFSLIEVLVILLILSGMFIVMQSVFIFSVERLNASKAKLIAVEIANSQIEILRNIDYSELGTISGSPSGSIPAQKVVVQSDTTFTLQTTVRYFDDPFDGCVGVAEGLPENQWSKCADGTVVEKPRDIPTYQNNPADYKKINVSVTWDGHFSGVPVVLSTTVAPKNLEGDTDKGFLLIKVINAGGVAVAGADVHITNNQVVPNVDITMSTDSNGQLLLFDMEPSLQSYVVRVTKSGYTTDRTCSVEVGGATCTDSEGVPDPFLRDASVHQGELDELTFIIDQFSTLAINSYTEQCEALDNINFTLRGLDKKISVSPEILKNEIDVTTNTSQSPHWSTSALEWDLYDLIVNTAGYYIAGVNHDLALNILPNTSTTINVLLAAQVSNALLVTAKDSGTGTNLSGAQIRVVSDDQSYDQTKVTGQGFLEQSDWSGGSGQALFVDPTKYFSDDAAVDVMSTTGQVSLVNLVVPLVFNEDFSTTTNKDAVNTTADWNTVSQELKLVDLGGGTYTVSETQYTQTLKINSVYGLITTATLSATDQANGETIRYFMSADGGATFESVSLPMGSPHTFVSPGSDLRVRIELETSNTNTTPIVQDFQVSYSLAYYETSGELISSTYDLGAAAPASSDFTTLSWSPVSQPAETGTASVRYQLASNTDNVTWNFIGPDGTSGTYYTGGSADIHSSHDGDRYVRYRLLVSTDDQIFTPTVTDVRIGYTLACLPPGQAYFSGTNSGNHVVEVKLDGYQDTNEVVTIGGYTTIEVLLTPIP